MKSSVSVKLTLLLSLLLLTLAISVSTSLSVLVKMKDDARIVNSLGFIRGSSQRVSLMIKDQKKKEIIQQVDKKFDEIDRFYSIHKQEYFNDNSFFQDYQQLKYLWKQLKRDVFIADKQDDLVNLSEKSWKRADTLANSFEQLSKQKHIDAVFLIYLLGSFVFVILILSLILTYTKVKNKLEVKVIQDPLTKLYNRSYLFIRLKDTIKSYERFHYPFSLIFIDLDHFKEINDKFGHSVGDQVLKKFSQLLKETLRENDLAFRYGGEEFLILAEHTKASEAFNLAERVRKTVEVHEFDTNFSVTISLGVSEYHEKQSIDDIINSADQMMYEAKTKGRNRTCV